MLVEATGVEQLVGNLKSASYRSSSDIQQKSKDISVYMDEPLTDSRYSGGDDDGR